jgi:uncharacterized protein YbgA (DUF1722 family)
MLSMPDFARPRLVVSVLLGVPRDPIRVVRLEGQAALYPPATGRDLSEAKRAFARRLKNFSLREHFLIRLFLLAELRRLQEALSIQPLIDYHLRHKLLPMALSQGRMRELGRILASHDRGNLPEITRRYEAELRLALARPPVFRYLINALQHAFGGLSPGLTAEERGYFLATLEECRDERVPLSVPLALLRAWALRQGNAYLLVQSLLEPYPRALAEITDSGKGRDA